MVMLLSNFPLMQAVSNMGRKRRIPFVTALSMLGGMHKRKKKRFSVRFCFVLVRRVVLHLGWNSIEYNGTFFLSF